MVYKNLNIPATLVHSVKGKEYTIKGNLTLINESNNTCTMLFGNKISNNIPLEEVYLNEALMDTLKAAGSKVKKGAAKAWNKIVDIVKAVGNFILPVDEDGNKIYEFFNSPLNIACMDLNNCIKCCPSEATMEVYDKFGIDSKAVSLDEAFADPEKNESRDANKYFGRIMKVFGSTDKSLEDSISFVKENYYTNAFSTSNVLNEANIMNAPRVYSGGENGNVIDTYGRKVNTKRLIAEIKTSIVEQLRAPKGVPRPLLIWGAPGIGKTAVIKQALTQMKTKGFDFEMITVCCGGLRDDDFELPGTVENLAGFLSAISIPVSWLPVFDHSVYNDPEQIAAVDEYYNSGEYKRNLVRAGMRPSNHNDLKKDDGSIDKAWDYKEWLPKNDGNKKRGGVIFFDEFSRLRTKKLTDTMMTIVGDRMYKGCEMASRWFMICAANSLFDDKQAFFSNNEFWQVWDPAKLARESHMRYVPTKEEWLNWARRADANGLQNVDEIICNFIELCTDDIWYNAMDIGSGYEQLPTAELKKIFKLIGDNEPLTMEQHKAFEKFLKSPTFLNKCLQTHDGRVWTLQIMSKIITWLYELLPEPTKSGYSFDDCFIETTNSLQNYYNGEYEDIKAKNLNLDILPKILNDIDDDIWNSWSFGREEDIISLNKSALTKNLRKTNRYQYFMLNIEELIRSIMGSESAPAKMWKIRDELNVMNNAAINEIVEKGKMSSFEDSIYFDSMSKYGEPLDNKKVGWNWAKYAWKQSTVSVDRVIVKFLQNCIDHITEREVKKDLKELAAHDGEKITDTEFNEWNKKYTITLYLNGERNKKIEIPVLTYDVDMFDPEQKQQVYDSIYALKYSEAARKLANIAMWLSQIAVLVKSNTPLTAASVKNIGDSNNYALDKQVFLKFYNVPGWEEYTKAHSNGARTITLPFDHIIMIMDQYEYGNI